MTIQSPKNYFIFTLLLAIAVEIGCYSK